MQMLGVRGDPVQNVVCSLLRSLRLIQKCMWVVCVDEKMVMLPCEDAQYSELCYTILRGDVGATSWYENTPTA